jgi:hypothetical protein
MYSVQDDCKKKVKKIFVTLKYITNERICNTHACVGVGGATRMTDLQKYT